MRTIVAVVLMILSVPAPAQDYEREQRWADQTLPTLLVGKAEWLQQKNGHSFLSSTPRRRLRAAPPSLPTAVAGAPISNCTGACAPSSPIPATPRSRSSFPCSAAAVN